MQAEWLESWVFRLFKNLLGYATVAIPGAILVHYLKDSKFLDVTDNCFMKYVRLFVRGQEEANLSEKASSAKFKRSTFQKTVTIFVCFVGLQLSYLTWGILQEKIMTQEYHHESETGKFSDSQFLVFVNRVLAFVFAGTYVLFSAQPKHIAPLYKYSYCSFSNIMSSWFQYEALKYVSFPTQVLAKASKIIPVMIMGKVISKKTYKYHEYGTAVAISIGTALFLLAGRKPLDIATSTTASGVTILLAYIISDSFTSNWQSALFKQYHMSSVQMMCGVNFFSCIFTSISLLQQGGFVKSFLFLMKFSNFLWDCILLSICSAVGQLFIFYTISEFGPVAFVIIMTVRQVLAILLSCLIYNHTLTSARILGVFIVFSTVFLRIYLNHRTKKVPLKKGCFVFLAWNRIVMAMTYNVSVCCPKIKWKHEVETQSTRRSLQLHFSSLTGKRLRLHNPRCDRRLESVPKTLPRSGGCHRNETHFFNMFASDMLLFILKIMLFSILFID